MKRFLLCFVCLIACMGASWAQNPKMASVLVSMPQELTYYIDGGLKHDMIALIKDQRRATVTNLMQGQSTLLDLTDDHFFLQTTESSSLEAHLLPVNDTTQIICLISTVYAPVADSKVRFFTTRWEELDGKAYFKTPKLTDFLKKEKREDRALLDCFDAYFVQYTFKNGSDTIAARLSSLDYMIDAEKLEPDMAQKEIAYKWSKTAFSTAL